ncbi:MAG TPA: acyltransferase [Opitutaceae bacterium]|jgi:peptidoglycan/LPS O-acetylase OafA/YrhL|nr:acyltransferase [Opitutaceae bacterium]
MGLIRVILALSVVMVHCGGRLFGLPITDGEMAVDSFFIISGFYMSLILTSRYQTQLGSFYFNRFLRLYPTYWMVLAACAAGAVLYRLAMGSFPPDTFHWSGRPGGWSVWGAMALANVFIVGTDVSFWFRSGAYCGYLVDPPVWSVGAEIFFYALAPVFAAASLPLLLGCFAAAAALREALWLAHGSQPTAWTYSFAPAALPLFLAGILAHRAYARLEKNPGRFPGRAAGLVLTGLFAAAILLQSELRRLGALAPLTRMGSHHWMFYLAFAASLPWIFASSKDRPFDNWMAGWSYPLYLCHWPVLALGAPLLALAAPALRPAAVVALTLVFAGAVLWLDQRVQRRFKRSV